MEVSSCVAGAAGAGVAASAVILTLLMHMAGGIDLRAPTVQAACQEGSCLLAGMGSQREAASTATA